MAGFVGFGFYIFRWHLFNSDRHLISHTFPFVSSPSSALVKLLLTCGINRSRIQWSLSILSVRALASCK
uniref:Uncharacterized protein n=1 Tax=Anguilla anguilla TaxID=7936 RepID=A0A0E9X4N2_ANGAN